jgi:hypothetical protein
MSTNEMFYLIHLLFLFLNALSYTEIKLWINVVFSFSYQKSIAMFVLEVVSFENNTYSGVTLLSTFIASKF